MIKNDAISRQWLFDRFNELDLLETYNDFKTVNTVIREAPSAVGEVIDHKSIANAGDKLKQLIERQYGDLENNRGCNVNGQWLSVAAIVELIDQATKE